MYLSYSVCIEPLLGGWLFAASHRGGIRLRRVSRPRPRLRPDLQAPLLPAVPEVDDPRAVVVRVTGGTGTPRLSQECHFVQVALLPSIGPRRFLWALVPAENE